MQLNGATLILSNRAALMAKLGITANNYLLTQIQQALAGQIAAQILAVENIPAFRAVTSNGKVADSATLAHIGKVCGVSRQTINTGFTGNIATNGERIENGAWAWVRGDVIYLSGTALSTTAPGIGFVQRMGTADSATSIVLEIGEPILL